MILANVFTEQTDGPFKVTMTMGDWKNSISRDFRRIIDQHCNRLGIVCGLNETNTGFELGFESQKDYTDLMSAAEPEIMQAARYPIARVYKALKRANLLEGTEFEGIEPNDWRVNPSAPIPKTFS